MSAALIVFAKAPVAGQAKTRLAPALGPDGAAALARRLLDHAVAQAGAAALALHASLELCVTPHAEHLAFARLALVHGLELTTQGGGDLGTRMDRALTRGLRRADRALLIGTDAPALDAALLLRAAQALDDADAIFVPALDGGYALVGLRAPAPRLFDGMAWSTPGVMRATRERAWVTGLRLAELPPVADIDEPADLVHLPAGWRAEFPIRSAA
jgi:rSAM/selenodomain-associated transferase 1